MKKGSVEFNWQVPKIRKNLSVSTIECIHCGNKVEIWSDEKHARCQNCGNILQKKDIDVRNSGEQRS